MAEQQSPAPRRPRSRRAIRRRDPRPRATLDVRLVLTTVPPRAAARIARTLVRTRVAACVNVFRGVASVYRWKGRVERASESLLVIKTTGSALPACQRALVTVHPYELPEVVVLTPTAVEARYAAWVRASTG